MPAEQRQAGPLLVEIKDSDDLRAWLDERPREDAVLIAARAALRVLPVLVEALRRSERRRRREGARKARAAIILPVCRAAAVASFAGTWPRQAAEVAACAVHAAHTASIYAVRADTAGTAADVIRAADAADAARAADGAPDYAMRAVGYAARAVATSAAADTYGAIERDVALLADGRTHEELGQTALWHGAPPAWAAQRWATLRDHLSEARAPGEHWQVWIDWYQARFDGIAANPALELEIARLPDTDWEHEDGPAHVNAKIAALVEKSSTAPDPPPDESVTATPSLPPARPAALRFRFDDGTVRLSQPDDIEPSNPDARVGWEMLRNSISEMLGGAAGGNKAVRAVLELAQNALGADFDAFNPLRLGIAGIAIDEFAKRADRILLEEDAAPFQAIALQVQLLIAQYPAWQRYLSAIAPPVAGAAVEQEVANDAAEIAEEMIEAHPEAFDPEAVEAIRDSKNAAAAEPTYDNPDAVAPEAARRSWIRVFGELMRTLAVRSLQESGAFASDSLKEARTVATKAVGGGSVAVVTAVGAKLTGLAEKLPAEYAWLAKLVDYLAAFVGL